MINKTYLELSKIKTYIKCVILKTLDFLDCKTFFFRYN